MRFGYITDVHNGASSGTRAISDIEFTEPEVRIWGADDVRWYSNAPDRLKAFGTTMQADGAINFVVDGGDLVDGQKDSQSTGKLAEAKDSIVAGTSADGWSGDIFYVIGNHEIGVYSDEGAAFNGHNNWDDYYLAIPAFAQSMRGNPHVFSTSTGGTTNTADYSYSFDRAGIHFVVCHRLSYLEGTGSGGTGSWLEEDLATTNKPIIIFTHSCSYVADLGVGIATIFGTATEANDIAEFKAITDAYNVQAIISGHTHIGASGGYPFCKVVDGVPRFTGHGNLINTSGSISLDHAAYYIFDVVPNAYKDKNDRWQANISVEGYSTNGTSMAKKAFIL